MKIKDINKEQKKIDIETLKPIIKSGLGLGLTLFFMKTGVIDYNNLANLDKIKDSLSMIQVPNLPFLNKSFIDIACEILEKGVNTVGIQGLAIAGKSFGLVNNIVKPIMNSKKNGVELNDNEKEPNSEIVNSTTIENNPNIKKIKKIDKKHQNTNTVQYKKNSVKTMSSILKVAKEGLAIGVAAYLMGTGQINYNSMYKFENLPHKLSFIGDIVKNIDLNKVKIGEISIESIRKLMSLKNNNSQTQGVDINSKKFSAIIHKIGTEGELPGLSAVQEFREKMLLNELGRMEGSIENNVVNIQR